MSSLPPKSDTERANGAGGAGDDEPVERTDFQSLMAGGVAERVPQKPAAPTDFHSLSQRMGALPHRLQHRSATDWLVDILTPVMIFVMVYSVIFFLIDVRYVYLELYQVDRIEQLEATILWWVALFFVVGVVALNRLIARDGREDSILYILGFGIAVGLYTLSTPVARAFPDQPWLATLFNIALVSLVWWVTNRLTHECCVDENPLAGDIGILTGTFRRMHNAISQEAPPAPRKPKKEPVILTNTLEPVLPSEWKRRERPKVAAPDDPTKRLPKRHPGISIFYVSIPVMVCFAVGERVLMNDTGDHAARSPLFVAAYTLAALSLLMLSSLGSLREYFRARRITIPGGLGSFWIGLGTLMIAVVLVGASRLPMPGVPSDGGLFGGSGVEVSRVMDIAGAVVLGFMGTVAAFALLRFAGRFALALSRRRRFGGLARLFGALDRFLVRVTQFPTLPKIQRTRRISREVALSTRYSNPLVDENLTPQEVVEYSYTALCALANDLAVPRRPDQTPYEFIESFPRSLDTIREEAIELTNLYVLSAYANVTLDERTLDRVRKFWRGYERVREAAVR